MEMQLYLLFVLLYKTECFKINKEIFTPKKNCKNIKCPPIEDPVCVKIKNVNEERNKEMFVMAINKCEMQYSKCNPGIEAVEVPMVNCKHDIRQKNRTKRYKREIHDEITKYSVYLSNSGVQNVKKDEEVSHDIEETEEQDDTDGDNHESSDNDEARLLHANDENEPGDESDKEKGDEGNNKNQFDDENTESEENHNENNQEHSAAEEDPILDLPLMEYDENDINDTNVIAEDYDQNVDVDVDYKEYKKDCPSVCPSQNVMVCGKCLHDIYRTFLSECYLRIFNCKYPEEKVELVKRHPCIQSSPFLTDFPKARGKLVESNDQDKILKFINCRAKGRLHEDPRCKFDDY